jgi:hypothetical protein
MIEEEELLKELVDLDEITITLNGQELGVIGLAQDILKAHDQLDSYKKGATTMTQALDEKIEELDSEDERIDALEDLRDTANMIYLRLERGDAEMRGDRDGEYSGHMSK